MCMCMAGATCSALPRCITFIAYAEYAAAHGLPKLRQPTLLECRVRHACRRYRLQDHPVADDQPARQLLADIDRADSDPEVRADAFGTAVLAPAVGAIDAWPATKNMQAHIIVSLQCISADEPSNTSSIGCCAGRKLCYDPKTLLQTLVGRDTECGGTGASGDARLLAHFKHDLLSGFSPK